MIGRDYVHDYQELLKAANDAGLMDRRRGFYWLMIVGSIHCSAL
jgi:hypothetical protein